MVLAEPVVSTLYIQGNFIIRTREFELSGLHCNCFNYITAKSIMLSIISFARSARILERDHFEFYWFMIIMSYKQLSAHCMVSCPLMSLGS